MGRIGRNRPARGSRGRHGRYGVNLLLLAAMYGGGVHASELFPGATDVVEAWRSYAQLWRAALTEDEWMTVVYAVRVGHRWVDGERDLSVHMETDPERPVDPVDLAWINDIPAAPPVPGRSLGWRYGGSENLVRHIAFTGDPVTAVAAHGLEPLFPGLAEAALIIIGTPNQGWDRTGTPDPQLRTFLHELHRLAVARATGQRPDDLSAIYLTPGTALAHWRDSISPDAWSGIRRMLLVHVRDDSRHLVTADLQAVLAELSLHLVNPRDMELAIDAVINHVAVVRPASEEWAEMQRRVATPPLGDAAAVQWMVGRFEAGVACDPVRIEHVDWDRLAREDPRLMARARAVFRLAFGRDLDAEIGALRRAAPSGHPTPTTTPAPGRDDGSS